MLWMNYKQSGAVFPAHSALNVHNGFPHSGHSAHSASKVQPDNRNLDCCERTGLRLRTNQLKLELQCELQLPWGICVHNSAECRAIRVAVDCFRAEELRVIEDVEGFHPEKELLRFS